MKAYLNVRFCLDHPLLLLGLFDVNFAPGMVGQSISSMHVLIKLQLRQLYLSKHPYCSDRLLFHWQQRPYFQIHT